MKLYFVLFLILLAQASYSQHPLTLSQAPTHLSLLAEGFISTPINERDFALSADGKEIYYTISTPRSDFQTIVVSHQISPGQWTSPEIVSFGGQYSDLEPAFSADGNTLYFASNRPISGTEPKDFDIWKVERKGNGWGSPINLGSPVNTEFDEFYPSLTKTGHLYFTASYKGQGRGREDIYKAEWKDGKYQPPVALDSAINSRVDEFNAFVSPEEDYILFTSYGRQGDAGGGDLYISVKDKRNQWLPARAIKELNTRFLEYCPYVSRDGKILFLTSNRYQATKSFPTSKATYPAVEGLWNQPLNAQGNIYWVDFSVILKSYRPAE